MKILSFSALAAIALAAITFLAASTAAEAGQCTTQIEALQKRLSAPSSGASVQPAPTTAPTTSSSAAGTVQGATGSSAPPNAAAAQEALDQARQLDKSGHEAECQAQVTKAKTAFGAQ